MQLSKFIQTAIQLRWLIDPKNEKKVHCLRKIYLYPPE